MAAKILGVEPILDLLKALLVAKLDTQLATLRLEARYSALNLIDIQENDIYTEEQQRIDNYPAVEFIAGPFNRDNPGTYGHRKPTKYTVDMFIYASHQDDSVIADRLCKAYMRAIDELIADYASLLDTTSPRQVEASWIEKGGYLPLAQQQSIWVKTGHLEILIIGSS